MTVRFMPGGRRFLYTEEAVGERVLKVIYPVEMQVPY